MGVIELGIVVRFASRKASLVALLNAFMNDVRQVLEPG
jgi:hypothetical protein